ncbi:hypothetical protein N7535_003977 [Penicillium sp. DV-2018c]|nr:hypothetical protein N7461_000320 [Penicillium sp. DV-2018c]KAJ5577051.1 hypothetical protein N7535_003977 [Penicillium sp. DV-2018c]
MTSNFDFAYTTSRFDFLHLYLSLTHLVSSRTSSTIVAGGSKLPRRFPAKKSERTTEHPTIIQPITTFN